MLIDITTWENLHCSGTIPSTFSDRLADAWTISRRNHVPYRPSVFPVQETAKFTELKTASLQPYAYANRCISLLQDNTGNQDICFAFFNSDGILLKLYGSEAVLKPFKEEGILPLSDWSMNALGANAVSVGLANKCCFSTCGTENYSAPLLDKAIYFAPCLTEHGNGTISYLFGGIAIITSLSQADPNYLILCASLAYDINLHIFMSNSLENAYGADERGILTIDQNLKTGKKYIIYHDHNLYNILGIPYSNIYFQPLENLIAQIPENEQFWNIINTQTIVHDFLLTLTVQGRTENFKITTEPYYQPSLAIKGIRIFFTSLRFLSAKISKNIGNSAVFTFDHLIGRTNSFEIALQQARVFSKSDKNVLIYGESGTGKDIFAQAIHNASSRANYPFISFSCGSLPREQLARELFGYENPEQHKIYNIGWLELAHNGTLYLDEIEQLPLDLQAILLSVIENKSFTRVGGYFPVYCDVRIIASTSVNLVDFISRHKFQANLYYRLNALHLFLPPLRDRKQDIILLAEHYIKTLCTQSHMELRHLSPETQKLLLKFPWHGNIRELQSTIESIILLTPAIIIEPEHIFEYINNPQLLEDIKDYSHSTNSKLTQDELIRTLQSCRYNKQLTAQKLGISRRTLYRYLEKYNLK